MENPENNQVPEQAPKTPKKIVKKKVVSGYGYGGGYGGYGYGGGYGSYGSYGGYGSYGYGGYGYGGGYGAQGGYGSPAGGGVPNRTFKDYARILWERIWYIIITFFVIFAGVLLYTFRITPVYTSAATVQVLRDSDATIEGPGSATQSMNTRVVNVEDFNTQVKILESNEIIKAVRSRMKEEDVKRFMAPYQDMFTWGPAKTEFEILAENRTVMPERMSLIIRVIYTHPDAQVAADIANLFAGEYISYTHQLRVKKMMDSIDELRTKVAQQEAKVKEIDQKLVEYREKNGAFSVDEKDDVDRSEMRDLNTILTTDKRTLDAISTQWNQIQEYKKEGRPLTDLIFIAEQPQISKLLMDKSTQQIYIATLEKRYKEKHPNMIQARKTLDQYEKELEMAIDSAYQKMEASYETARNNFEQSQKRLAEKQESILALGRKAIQYRSLERERQVAESLHASFIAAMNIRTAQINLINEGSVIVDKAGKAQRPSSPNIPLYVVGGLLLGLFGGFGVAFMVAFLDDRAKSAYDIEAIIGLPLLGVMPRIKRLNSFEKAQIAASNADRATTEAFRALYSTLKVNALGKSAKVILFTSTTPSEGKSFVVTNLAFTAALHGEKTIIIDADLRLPVMAKTLGIDAKTGLIGYIEEGKDLDSAIIRDFFPNLDVLPCERRSDNPTQALNSERFIEMIQKFRGEYDRIIIDSPPIGAVSDAISLLPNVDGVIYVVKFNSVKRKTIKGFVRRMMESNVPVLGAVMNMVNQSSASAYSMNYYDKSYQSYYTTPEIVEEHEEEQEQLEDKGEEK